MFVHEYVEVVDYSVFVQISTIVITNIDVFSVNFYDSHGDESMSSVIVTVDWLRWLVFTVNVFL
jgi:hypothetical protein